MNFSITNLVMFILSTLLLTNTAFGALEETTALGKNPRAIVINPDTNMIYVANSGSKTISVIDGSTHQVTANIRAGESLEELAVNPATNTVYATNYWPKKLSVIDASTNSLVKKITVEEHPLDVVVNPYTNLVYIAGKKIPEVPDNTIYIIDGLKNTITDTIEIKGSPTAMTINPALNLLYVSTVANETSTLQVIDLDTKSIYYTLGIDGTFAMVANPTTDMIYLSHGWGVSIVNSTSKTIARFPVGGDTESITVNPKTNVIYVSNPIIDAVTVINGTTNFAWPVIQVGYGPVALAINPDANILYVTNAGSDTVSVIDTSTNTVIDTIGKERKYDCSKLKIRNDASEDGVSKFGEEFYEKIKFLIESGETRHYAVYIWVSEFDEEDNDSTRLNKGKVECLLRHLGATNIYPARVLEFVSAQVPLDQLFSLASYPFIDSIDDAEIEEEPLGGTKQSIDEADASIEFQKISIGKGAGFNFFHFPPSLVTDSEGSIHVVWSVHDEYQATAEKPAGFSGIWYAKVDFNGDVEVQPKILTGDSFTLDVEAAVSNDRIHIVWSDSRDVERINGSIIGSPNIELYYMQLDNHGNIVINATRLTYAKDLSESPSITNDSEGRVHVVWLDWRDSYSKLIGARPNCTPLRQGACDIYESKLLKEIYYMKLDTNGNKIINDTRITFKDSFENAVSDHPKIAFDGSDQLHVAWTDRRHSTDSVEYTVYYTKLDLSGNKLIPDLRVTDGADAVVTDLAVDSEGNAHVVWSSNILHPDSEEGDVYKTTITKDGKKLTKDMRLSSVITYASAGSPQIAIDSQDNVHVIWKQSWLIDDGPTPPLGFESGVYYTRINSNGTIEESSVFLNNAVSYTDMVAVGSKVYVLSIDHPEGLNLTIVPEFPISVLIASLAIGLLVAIMRLRSVKIFLH